MTTAGENGQLPRVLARSVTDRAYEAIRAAIVEGHLVPGKRLSEESLAEQLGVSKTPVHDALGRLVADGLVQMVPYQGASVVQLTSEDVNEIYTLREKLECLAIQLAVAHVDESLLQSLDAGFSSFQRPLRHAEFSHYFEIDARVHDAIAQMSCNRRLMRYLNSLRSQALAARYISSRAPGYTDGSIDEHRAVVGALLARDAANAEEAMRRHLDAARQAALRAMEEIDRKIGTQPLT
jgi:DNA-binding GntR family transcriptional regulator